ncbi:hypothetical protein K3X44_10035 [Aliiroseovarius crassostreae]|uniref:hypothetical protein n=1 Tax=Aliiroseovarius crassostreae TaxID=154981 RepID=UPI0021FAC497|nr:hypothetical protein [Aliiroseovarius crassostreae]UWQ00853.1 hypothetical protein K3X44_10035 [Aliiroseovarius crassostreae]
MSKKTEKKSYRVLASGWIADRWRKEGATVELTKTQAKYENVTPVVIGVDLAKGPDKTIVAPAPTAKRGRAKK